MSESHDDLYTKVHPDYFEVQRKDLWFYERLWTVLLRQLERRHPQRTLIEFGSGPGFLCAMAERRWLNRCSRGGMFPAIHGIEPSSVARDHAEKLPLRAVDFRDRYNGLSLFRHAIATEVLEHVDDPKAALEEWRSALIPGGFLALSVPNDNNPLQRLFWGRSKPWIHHTHRHYFSRHSLKAVVESAGFEVVWQGSSFPVELLLAIPLLPRKAAWKLSRLWPAPPLLWRLGIGRHCLLVARKAT